MNKYLFFLIFLIQSPVLLAINAGDSLTFNGKWEAPTYDEMTKTWGASKNDIPLNGARITIRDKSTPPAAEITGFVVNGSFAFTAPSNNFDIILRASHPGFTTTGGINTSSTNNVFEIVQGMINSSGTSTTKGPVYSFNIGMNLNYTASHSASVNSSSNNLTASQGDVWAVFHGMAEMLEEARRQLKFDKNSFDIAFPAHGSFFNRTDIFLLRADRYDWDIVGHELGHAVEAEQEHVDPNASPGGDHDGTNQYDLADNTLTHQKKDKSLGLAWSEGAATWFAVGLLERSSLRNQMSNVGDGKYVDTEDGTGVGVSLDSSSTSAMAYGDDTEEALFHMLWDMHDSRADANTRTTQAINLSDQTALGVKGLWDTLTDSSGKSVSEWYVKAFLPNSGISDFLPAPGSTISDTDKLDKALRAGDTLAEFGIAPLLTMPQAGDKLELAAASGVPLPRFEWTQLATVNNDLKLNKFTLAIYSGDKTTLLFKKENLTAKNYTLTQAELDSLRVEIEALPDEIATALIAVSGSSDVKTPNTGPYLSQGTEVLLQDFNRAMVAVVDSSGSNQQTDPTNQRVVASRESLQRLTSMADVMADPTLVPDIAAAIDFDSGVSVLSSFADPDIVIPSLSSIDSSGGTSIDSGINSAINLLDDINLNDFFGLFSDRAAILVFTDGQNNSGDGPVINAIVAATLKGYRVHYGFLSPLVGSSLRAGSLASETLNQGVSGDGDPETYFTAKSFITTTIEPTTIEEAVGASAITTSTRPTTIEEAVLQSGGVFAQIGDAQSQIAFIEQVFARGLTNVDGLNGGGGGFIVGQANTADQLTPEFDIRSFSFNGQQNEEVAIRVESADFQPNVTVFDRDGGILALEVAAAGANSVTLELPPLPYSGEYIVQIFAEDGRTGLFNIFVDVQNMIGQLPVIENESNLTFNRQTGLFEQTISIRNSTGSNITGFQIDVSNLPVNAIVANAADNQSVIFNGNLPNGESIQFVIEYFDPARNSFTPTLSVTPNSTTIAPPLLNEPIDVGGFMANDGSFVVEFASVPDTLYFIQYSDDSQIWRTVLPPIDARGTRVQWIDSGPPKTSVHPSQAGVRFYRVATQRQ